MFGGLTFLLSGNMLCCVSAKALMARIGAAAEPAALAKPYAAPCLGTDGGWRGSSLWSRGVASGGDLKGWLALALAYVEQLPRRRQVAAPPPTAVASNPFGNWGMPYVLSGLTGLGSLYNHSVVERISYTSRPQYLDAVFAALADPTRRAILSRLATGEAS